MKTEYQPEESAFLRQTKPPFQLSKEEVWDQLLSKIEEGVPVISLHPTKAYWRWAIAATILLLCLCSFAANRYTLTHKVPFADQKSVFLPDSSKVILRAGSQISYKPLWWYISRELTFEGEAYFQVKKGSQFSVLSQRGTTKVLGTQFQITTFAQRYEVYCQEGRVGVQVPTIGEPYVLAAGERLSMQSGHWQKETSNDKKSLAWLNRKFNFDATPIAEALAEIERSYAIEIQYDSQLKDNQLLTAAFDQMDEPQSCLAIIGEVFDLKISQSGPSSYVLSAQ